MDHRREIDGLRAIAVVPVILFHAGFGLFSGGFVGVDVFFVISGYLIASIILSDLEQGKFSLADFYERRARRILPALFFVMLACFPFAWMWLLPGDMKGFLESVAAVSLFVSNIFFWMETGYFDTAGELKPLIHTWSLAVEEQYYALFPLFLLATWRLGRRWIVAIIMMICIIGLGMAERASISDPEGAFYLLPTRGWELLMGALAAFHLSRNPRPEVSRAMAELLGWTGLALILYAVFAYSRDTTYPGIYTLVPTCGAVLIIIYATPASLAGKFIGIKAFSGLGLLSYSAYLWHQPIFAFARHRSSVEPEGVFLGVLCLAAFVLAYFSWKYVESPFRDKTRFTRRSIIIICILFSLFFLVIGYSGAKTDRPDQRFVRTLTGDVGQLEFHQYIDENYFDCEPSSIAEKALKWKGFLRCKQSKRGTPDVILLGDSHAEHLFLGLAEARKESNVAFYILSGNPFVTDAAFKDIYTELLGNKIPQHILLTMHFAKASGSSGDEIHRGLSTSIAALQGAGKRVSIIGDIPRFEANAAACVYMQPSELASSTCYMSRGEVNAQKRGYHRIVDRIAKNYGVTYIQTDGIFCFDSKCGMMKEGVILYRDKNHLNIPGSRLVGRYISERLAP